MIPLSDTEPNRYIRRPYMVITIILLNIAVLIYEYYLLLAGYDVFMDFIYRYGLVPRAILEQRGGGALSAITQMFLHGGTLHLFGNMVALAVYGRRVEDACGPWRFLLFYLTVGVLAEVIYVLAEAKQEITGIGASGAVFGVMGAYLILYPTGRIRTLIFLWFVPIFPKIRAYWIILYFFVIQIIPALQTLLDKANYQVAHWAHLGGFIASLTVFFFLRPEAFHRYQNEMAL